MPTSNGVVCVPQPGLDNRIRVFRRSLGVVEPYELMEVDAYAVITTRYVVICDTLLCPEDMVALVQEVRGELQGRQLLVINSHADWDHCWGNGYFSEANAAPIIAHERCRAHLLSEAAHSQLAEYQRFPIFRNVVLEPPTVTFAQTLTLYGGDLALHLLHAPGHQSEHLALWIPEVSVLLAFDAAEMPFPHIENAEAVPAMLATLERLRALAPQMVLCSHTQGTSPAVLDENLAYLREIEQRCRAFLGSHHLNEDQIKQAIGRIDYPFEAIVAPLSTPIDQSYREAHQDNMRCMMQWLLHLER